MKQDISLSSTGSEEIIKISGKLLGLIMPTMTMTLGESK
jgi:hypothetical protein